MPDQGTTPIPRGNQDSIPAQEAFAAYADLVRSHAEDAETWDRPDRVQARKEAHGAFVALFWKGVCG